MKEALQNIFGSRETITSYATVSARISSTRYEVTDIAGRVSYAEATDFYPIGVSVVIQDGRIVGPGTRAGKHRIYEV